MVAEETFEAVAGCGGLAGPWPHRPRVRKLKMSDKSSSVEEEQYT
jgi:hypothetical protein